MGIVRSRKARLLEKAGLRYVAGWLDAEDAAQVLVKIVAAQPKVAEALQNG